MYWVINRTLKTIWEVVGSSTYNIHMQKKKGLVKRDAKNKNTQVRHA